MVNTGKAPLAPSRISICVDGDSITWMPSRDSTSDSTYRMIVPPVTMLTKPRSLPRLRSAGP